MKVKNLKKPEALFSDENIKSMYSEMETAYIQLYKSGYRQMPEEMYMQWLDLLRKEPDRYTNQELKINSK
jgi:hypothetical protein